MTTLLHPVPHRPSRVSTPDPGGYTDPFTSTVFRTPLPATPAIAGSSSTLVTRFTDDIAAYYGTVGINIAASTPCRYVVHGNQVGTTPVKIVGYAGSWSGVVQVPIPTDAICDPGGTDHELVIWDVDNDVVWEFWAEQAPTAAGRPADGWSFATYATQSTTTGSGVFTRGAESNTCSASGLSYLAAQITAKDIAAGVIGHAIACAMVSTASPPVAPALYSDGSTSGGVPEGTLFFFPSSVTMPTGLCSLAQMIFTAIQTYGMYVIDTAGAVTVYTENSNSWTFLGLADPISPSLDGVASYEAITGFPWSQMEVVAPPGSTSAPVFVDASPPTSAYTSTAYSYTFTATGSPAPTFSVASGTLPAGLSLSTAGVLSGTVATTTGTSTFVVAATNSVGTVSTGNISITVSAPAAIVAAQGPLTSSSTTATASVVIPTLTAGRSLVVLGVNTANGEPSGTPTGVTGVTWDTVWSYYNYTTQYAGAACFVGTGYASSSTATTLTLDFVGSGPVNELLVFEVENLGSLLAGPTTATGSTSSSIVVSSPTLSGVGSNCFVLAGVMNFYAVTNTTVAGWDVGYTTGTSTSAAAYEITSSSNTYSPATFTLAAGSSNVWTTFALAFSGP